MNILRLFGKGGKEKPILLDSESDTTDIYIELLNPDMCMTIEGSKELAVALLQSASYAQEKAYGITQGKQDISRQAVFMASRLYSIADTDAIPYSKEGQSLFVEYFQDPESMVIRRTGRYFKDEKMEIPVDKSNIKWECPYLEFPLLAEFVMDNFWDQYDMLNLLPESSELSKEEQNLWKDKCVEVLRGMVTDVFATLHPLTSMYATGLFTKSFVTEQSNVSEVDPGKEHRFECKQNTASSLFLRLFLEKMQKYYRKRGLCLRIFHYPQHSHRHQWEKTKKKVYEAFPKKKVINDKGKSEKTKVETERFLRPTRSRIYFPLSPVVSHDDDDEKDIEEEIKEEKKEQVAEEKKERIRLTEEERKRLLREKKEKLQNEMSSQSNDNPCRTNIGILTYQHVYDSTAFMVIMNTPPEALPHVKIPRQMNLSLEQEETQKRTHKL